MPKISDPIRKVTVAGKVRYKVVVDVGTVNGQRKQRRATFDTRRKALDWLAETRTAVTRGSYVSPSKLTVERAVADWLASKASEVRPATLGDYRSSLRPLVELLGTTPVQDVRRIDIERVRDSLVAKGLKQRSSGKMLTLTRQLWQWLVDNKVATHNPAENVNAAGAETGDLTAFTPEALVKIRKAIVGHWLEPGFLLSLYGMRRSEVLGIRWGDLDVEWSAVGKPSRPDEEPSPATLAITRSRVKVAGLGDSVGATKTRRGVRTLPLDPDLLGVLAQHRREQASVYGLAQVSGGYVVIDELGRGLDPERYSDEWKAMLADAGVPYLDLRAARRSSVTAMRQRGVPDHLVAAWHGHDEEVMRRHYSVALDDGLRDAGQVLTAVFRQAQ